MSRCQNKVVDVVAVFGGGGGVQVSGTWDGRVCLWDLRNGSMVEQWETHNERVWAVALDNYRIVSAGLDRNIVVRSFIPSSSSQQDAQQTSNLHSASASAGSMGSDAAREMSSFRDGFSEETEGTGIDAGEQSDETDLSASMNISTSSAFDAAVHIGGTSCGEALSAGGELGAGESSHVKQLS
jgi:WD40 repeat protein